MVAAPLSGPGWSNPWLQELRRAVVRPDQDRLTGRIEPGESYLSCQEECLCGPQTSKTAILAIAVEANRGEISRATLNWVPDLSPSSLREFLAEQVLPESFVNTCGWCACEGLANRSAEDRLTTTSRVGSRPTEAGAAALLER